MTPGRSRIDVVDVVDEVLAGDDDPGNLRRGGQGGGGPSDA